MSQGNLVNSSDSQNQTKKGKSIKMKIFCNICMVRIGKNDIRGIVTSCQHIVCHICFDLETAKSPKACPKCKRPHISTMKIERNMPAHMMEYFLPPDLKFQQAIDAVNFQNKHMDVDGLLKQLRRKEEYNLGKVELAERKALAEWNELYNAKLEEYRQKFRLSYRYMTSLQANKADLPTQRAALKEAHILVRKAEKLLEVNPDPDDTTLAPLIQKHLALH